MNTMARPVMSVAFALLCLSLLECAWSYPSVFISTHETCWLTDDIAGATTIMQVQAQKASSADDMGFTISPPADDKYIPGNSYTFKVTGSYNGLIMGSTLGTWASSILGLTCSQTGMVGVHTDVRQGAFANATAVWTAPDAGSGAVSFGVTGGTGYLAQVTYLEFSLQEDDSTGSPSTTPSSPPTVSPTKATLAPSILPTSTITTASPSKSPITSKPSSSPTITPTSSTSQPTSLPTNPPSTASSTSAPSSNPSSSPIASTPAPTSSPSVSTTTPTASNTDAPTHTPTTPPSQSPSKLPTLPTLSPSTRVPTTSPTVSPSPKIPVLACGDKVTVAYGYNRIIPFVQFSLRLGDEESNTTWVNLLTCDSEADDPLICLDTEFIDDSQGGDNPDLVGLADGKCVARPGDDNGADGRSRLGRAENVSYVLARGTYLLQLGVNGARNEANFGGASRKVTLEVVCQQATAGGGISTLRHGEDTKEQCFGARSSEEFTIAPTGSPTCAPDVSDSCPDDVKGCCHESAAVEDIIRRVCTATCCGVVCSDSISPTTSSPSISPSSSYPTAVPSSTPTTTTPTPAPTCANDTLDTCPTDDPSGCCHVVAAVQSIIQLRCPKSCCGVVCTTSPSVSPSTPPTLSPTHSPTLSPSVSPSVSPSISPSTSNPTRSPSVSPTTSSPSISPSNSPTTSSPTTLPTLVPRRPCDVHADCLDDAPFCTTANECRECDKCNVCTDGVDDTCGGACLAGSVQDGSLCGLPSYEEGDCNKNCHPEYHAESTCVAAVPEAIFDWGNGFDNVTTNSVTDWSLLPRTLKSFGTRGSNYYFNRGVEDGYAAYDIPITRFAWYNVSVSYSYSSKRSSNVFYTITHDDGVDVVRVDHTQSPSNCVEIEEGKCKIGFELLGSYAFSPAGPSIINITSIAGDGSVTADAVLVVPTLAAVRDGRDQVECALCHLCNRTAEFTSTPCTHDSNSACTDLTTCDEGTTFETNAPTSTTDRGCSLVSTCNASVEHEVTVPTLTSDRECEPHSACEAGYYERVAPNADGDRGCEECTTGSYQPLDDSIATECVSWRTCGPGEFTEVAGSTIADQLCSPCPQGTFRVGGVDDTSESCQPHALCRVGQYASTSPTNSTDRECDGCADNFFMDKDNHTYDECKPTTECAEEQYLLTPGTVTTDAKCANLSVCGPGEAELGTPTATSDRGCGFDGVCDSRDDVFDVAFVMDGSGSVGFQSFDFQRQFVLKVIDALSRVANDSIRVAAVVYGAETTQVFDFTMLGSSTPKETIVDELLSFQYGGNQPSTTASALDYVSETLLKPSKGYRGRGLVVVLLDGQSLGGIATLTTAANRLHAVPGIDVIAIGIDFDGDDLDVITNTGDLPLTFGSFQELAQDTSVASLVSLTLSCNDGYYESSTCSSTLDRICNKCKHDCGDGNFLAGNCRGTTDFSCEACSKECDVGEYVDQRCDGVSDRTCTTCSSLTCTDDEYVVACSEFSDSECKACGTTCAGGLFNNGSCTDTSDIVCDTCQPPCDTSQGLYESKTCAFDHNRECSSCSGDCEDGAFLVSACAATADRECDSCVPECLPDDDEYESTACTTSTNRECTGCTTCTQEHYQVQSCTPEHNRECEVCDDACADGFYESVSCTPTSNRQCTQCGDVCDIDGAPFYEAAECTTTSDRVCASCNTECPTDTYQTGDCGSKVDIQCTECKVCEGETYASQQCTADTNTVCRGCSERCLGGFFEESKCTSSTDRKCVECSTTCFKEEHYRVDSCTLDHDLCVVCDQCGDDEYKTVGCTETSNRECEDCKTCGADQFAVTPCDGTIDRECANCSDPCPDGTDEVVPCSGTTDRKCAPVSSPAPTPTPTPLPTAAPSTVAPTTAPTNACASNCGSVDKGGGTCRAEDTEACLSCNPTRVLAKGKFEGVSFGNCLPTVTCKNQKIGLGSLLGYPCRCSEKFCHFCVQKPGGFENCRKCRNSQFLLENECLESCPPEYTSKGVGVYGRKCLPPFTCKKRLTVGLDVNTGCKCTNEGGSCHTCLFEAGRGGEKCIRCTDKKLLNPINYTCQDDCSNFGDNIIEYRVGRNGGECRAPFQCVNGLDESGVACRCPRAMLNCVSCTWGLNETKCDRCGNEKYLKNGACKNHCGQLTEVGDELEGRECQ